MPLLTIHHDLRQVRQRLERFGAGVNKIPAAIVQDTDWLERARKSAREVLSLLAQPQDRQLVDQFIEAISVIVFLQGSGSEMIWTMDRVREVKFKLADLTEEQKDILWRERKQFLDRSEIEEWVANEKVKTGEDRGRSDEEITRRILAILFGPPNEQREAAGRSLMFGSEFKYENNLLENQAGFLWQFLNADEINAWMNAVRTVWREMILEDIPAMIRDKIRTAWSESKAA